MALNSFEVFSKDTDVLCFFSYASTILTACTHIQREEKRIGLGIVEMFTRHLSKSFSLSSCLSLGQSFLICCTTILCQAILQSAFCIYSQWLSSVYALKSVLPKFWEMKNSSSLSFSVRKNGSFCFSLPCCPKCSSQSKRFPIRPIIQFSGKMWSLGYCLMFLFTFIASLSSRVYLIHCSMSSWCCSMFLRLFPSPNIKSTTFYVCWSVRSLYCILLSPFLFSTHLSFRLHLETDIMDQMDSRSVLTYFQSSSEMYF